MLQTPEGEKELGQGKPRGPDPRGLLHVASVRWGVADLLVPPSPSEPLATADLLLAPLFCLPGCHG